MPRSPKPTRLSGRFVLRLPPPLHGVLQAAARASGISLNEYCVRRLSAGGPALAADGSAAAIVNAAAALAGDALVGVIVYGSWARGEAGASSDVDVLVVVDRRLALTRSLYRKWDRTPATWLGRRVDPHFVHPPGARVAGGVWGEVAIDGIVLFERDWRLSARLVEIRRSIAAGRLVRRFVHGQPYWTVAA
jgi:predicted nucleotidyltransferase